MPTYDYECDACGHQFELFQRITEDPLKKCPECKRNKLRRLFGTGAAVVFKGSGFYQTDYRSESWRKGESADKKEGTPDSAEGKTGDTKSKETKPAESASASADSGDKPSTPSTPAKSSKKNTPRRRGRGKS